MLLNQFSFSSSVDISHSDSMSFSDYLSQEQDRSIRRMPSSSMDTNNSSLIDWDDFRLEASTREIPYVIDTPNLLLKSNAELEYHSLELLRKVNYYYYFFYIFQL
jgi:hypothetical protein